MAQITDALLSGQLPLEDRHDEWNVGLDSFFQDARRPFDVLRDIIVAPGVRISPTKPCDDPTVLALLALATKILKAYRGMLLLCEAGHGHEAVVLLRYWRHQRRSCGSANTPILATQPDRRLRISS